MPAHLPQSSAGSQRRRRRRKRKAGDYASVRCCWQVHWVGEVALPAPILSLPLGSRLREVGQGRGKAQHLPLHTDNAPVPVPGPGWPPAALRAACRMLCIPCGQPGPSATAGSCTEMQARQQSAVCHAMTTGGLGLGKGQCWPQHSPKRAHVPCGRLLAAPQCQGLEGVSDVPPPHALSHSPNCLEGRTELSSHPWAAFAHHLWWS